MKVILFFFLVFLISISANADEWVSGYIKKDGSYVQGYFKSSPNSTNTDNYSTQGNTNPYTGAEGHKAQDYSPAANTYGNGKPIYTGPKGGQYYYSDSGRKVYVPKQ
jgi:hypothetical protein